MDRRALIEQQLARLMSKSKTTNAPQTKGDPHSTRGALNTIAKERELAGVSREIHYTVMLLKKYARAHFKPRESSVSKERLNAQLASIKTFAKRSRIALAEQITADPQKYKEKGLIFSVMPTLRNSTDFIANNAISSNLRVLTDSPTRYDLKSGEVAWQLGKEKPKVKTFKQQNNRKGPDLGLGIA